MTDAKKIDGLIAALLAVREEFPHLYGVITETLMSIAPRETVRVEKEIRRTLQ
jgi:hypothetical protein